MEHPNTITYTDEPATMGMVFKDFVDGLKLWRIWWALAVQEFKATYHRSVIGILWVTLSFAGFVFVKLLVFPSLIATEDPNFYNLYLTVGFYMWYYYMPVITTASSTFLASKGWILSVNLPLSVYIYKNITRELLNFGLTTLVIIAAFWYLKFMPPLSILWAIPGFIFILFNAFWFKLLFGVFGARVTDIGHFISALMLPLMFLTPIFWTPDQMPNLMKVLWWNPLYHAIELVRQPLIGRGLPVESWIYMFVLCFFGTIAALFAFKRFRKRLIFWL